MCGSTAAQGQLQAEQMAFYQQGMDESKIAFAESQQLQQQVKAVYDPILAAGPNQYGFSPGEEATLESQAIEGTAKNFRQSSQALKAQIAGEGGGNVPGLTGSQEQLQAELNAASTGEQSREQTQIKEAGYAQGHQLFTEATGAEMGISGQLNPTAFESAATSSGKAAGDTASAIAQEQNSWVNAVIGAAGSIGGAVIGENPKNIFG
jgi:hypothetical protein